MLTLTKHAGIGGIIKQTPEDFLVKEITGNGTVLEPGRQYDAKSLGLEEVKDGKHISFVLEKRDWNTIGALMAVAKKLSRGRKSIGYAGAKDKKALTVQLASVYHPEQFDIGSVSIKDIRINGSWRSNGVEMGSDLGNAFEIRLKEVENPSNSDEIIRELNGRMPNYFGEQRFGERGNNHKVGLALLKGDFESAVSEYLTSTENERNERVLEARRKLAESMDFKEALGYFPKYMKGERTVIAHLAENPGNYANAIRRLPRGIALMFVHAVQSLIFNKELEERVRSGDFDSKMCAEKDFYGFPDMEKIGAGGAFPLAVLAGYETREEEMSEYTKKSMESLKIDREDFRLRGIPELNMKGSYRPLLAPVLDVRSTSNDEEIRLSFSLPKGSYATVLLNEFMKMEGVAEKR